MAGLTPTAFADFRRLLRARGSSLEQLAQDVGTSRPYLSQVLWGRFASPDTWARIHAVVTPEEWAALSHVEHCPAWNNPHPDLPWCMWVVCAYCKEPQHFKRIEQPMEPGAISHGACPACYAKDMAKIAAIRPKPVAHLVRTDAGLQVHTAPAGERPAMAAACDFEHGDAVEMSVSPSFRAVSGADIGRPFSDDE